MDSRELLAKIEQLKNIVMNRAAPDGMDKAFDHSGYVKLRTECMGVSRIQLHLPNFIRNCRTLDEFWAFISSEFEGSGSYRLRKAYIREQFLHVLAMAEEEVTSPSDDGITAVIVQINSEHVREVWQKALERRALDPDGAITLSRTLLEAICKHVLDDKGIIYDGRADLPVLYRATATSLKIAPSQQTEDIMKRVLGGCQSIVEGIGALRNQMSDAHARGKTGTGPELRHAELAVNLAGTMASYLLATWEADQS